jgi:hypothetical protein
MCGVTGPDDLRRAVAEHGWVVVTTPARGDRPTVTSTVGLTEQDVPELVVLGLPEEIAGALLHEVAERLLADFGEDDGVPLPDLLDGEGDPTLVTVHGPVVGLPACELYGQDLFLRQLVWPDAEGRLPWHPGFAHPDLQPLMAEPPLPHAQVTTASADLPEWPLPDDPHVQVLTSRKVAEQGLPVLLVTCTDDSELWFLDGVSDFDEDAAVVECLHEALERDLTLVDAVRPLQPGQVAERNAVGEPWTLDEW